MLSWPLRPHSGMIKLEKINLRKYKTTTKTSNYFTKLPQEASIKNIQTFRNYDLITLNLPAPRQRLCPRCGSTNCVIKDSSISPHFFRCFLNPIRSFSVSPDHLKTLSIHTALSDAFLVALPFQ